MFQIANDRAVSVTVWIEPWGRDYTLDPGEEVSLEVVEGGPAPDLHLSVIEGGFQLYVNSPCTDAVVWKDGMELPCGYNRKPDTGAAS